MLSKLLFFLKPNARRVPISLVRLATAAFIVIIDPIVAPTEKMMVKVIPKILMNLDSALD